jgi:hypothetical protein
MDSSKIWKNRNRYCHVSGFGWLTLAGVVLILSSPVRLQAQALGWEGETGVFVTPLAYTASAEGQKLHPVVAYHYFNAGEVIGDFHEASVEVGIGKHLEAGYTREFHVYGSDASLSPLWSNGFDIFNGKAILIPENLHKQNWVPAVSVGFIARAGDRNVGNYLWEHGSTTGKMSGQSNGDIYLVGSKVVLVKNAGAFSAFVLNAGVRGTNAELWGMGGNAPDWEARAFGAVAFAFKGPDKSSLIFASEAAQQPHHPGENGTPLALNIPTTLTYCVRVVPSPKHKLNFDFGIAQIAGEIAQGTNLKARHQAGFQVSYGF